LLLRRSQWRNYHPASLAPDHAILQADVVNLGFVINVIEDPAERIEALERAFRLSPEVMCVGVMLYGSDLAGRSYRDGFVTALGTFQKYFTHGHRRV
jgi:DNA phosphorothioation-associated putative methyltransferase